MRTFAELLAEHTSRAGISDSELARTLGVSRQTIFRWKEGLVEKPRYRDDVLKIAARLRLMPPERDELLLAAGFPPENAPPATMTASTLSAPAPRLPAPTLAPAPLAAASAPLALPLPRQRALPSLNIVLTIVVALTLVIILGNLAVLLVQPAPGYPIAAPGEMLIVIAPLGDAALKAPTDLPSRRLPPETVMPPPTDATSRVQTAIEREVRAARLARVRVAVGREAVADAGAAERARQRAQAVVVLWGVPRDAHLVVALAAAPLASRADDLPLDALVAVPTDARFEITPTSAEEVRALALLTLSQVYLGQGEFGLARAALTQALSQLPPDAATQAAWHLQMGYALQIAEPPEIAGAIQAYSQTLALAPAMTTPYLNRGVAAIRLNDAAQWQADFARVLALAPDDLTARRALCWAHALDRAPAAALPHCDAAVRADTTARSREARAVVYAELGRLADAAADLQAFCDWLARQPESLRARYGASRAVWLQSLQAGQNPLDAATLERLRRE